MDMARWFDGLWREGASGRGGYVTSRRGLPELAHEIGRPDMAAGCGNKLSPVRLPHDGVSVRAVKAESASFHGAERRLGRPERRFGLPSDIDLSAATADFRDGVLNVVGRH